MESGEPTSPRGSWLRTEHLPPEGGRRLRRRTNGPVEERLGDVLAVRDRPSDRLQRPRDGGSARGGHRAVPHRGEQPLRKGPPRDRQRLPDVEELVRPGAIRALQDRFEVSERLPVELPELGEQRSLPPRAARRRPASPSATAWSAIRSRLRATLKATVVERGEPPPCASSRARHRSRYHASRSMSSSFRSQRSSPPNGNSPQLASASRWNRRTRLPRRRVNSSTRSGSAGAVRQIASRRRSLPPSSDPRVRRLSSRATSHVARESPGLSTTSRVRAPPRYADNRRRNRCSGGSSESATTRTCPAMQGSASAREATRSLGSWTTAGRGDSGASDEGPAFGPALLSTYDRPRPRTKYIANRLRIYSTL